MAIVTVAFSSCGKRSEAPVTDVDTTLYALAREEGPGHDTARSLNDAEATYNGKHYVISISIAPDDSLIVKDSYGDPYLDNNVTVAVTADGTPLFTHVFKKKEFAEAGSGLPMGELILGGLAFNSIDGGGIHLSAQLNEPGDIEGGSVFKVTFPLAGGTPSIVRDTTVADVDMESGD